MKQLVQVRFDTGPQLYTYSWEWSIDGMVPPLKVGDRVTVPANWRTPHPSDATVAALGSDFMGPVREIIARALCDGGSGDE